MKHESSNSIAFLNSNSPPASFVGVASPEKLRNDDTATIGKTIDANSNGKGGIGMSSDDFWKNSNKDISNIGFKSGGKQSSKVLPFGGSTGGLSSKMDQMASIQERYKYDKERDRDPAMQMAANHYRKVHSLRIESSDDTFSYLCSSVDTILDNSNSHPSFRVYYGFLKRFMIVSFIICLLQLCSLVYIYSCEWYSDKDIKFGYEEYFLGNIDGVAYLSQGDYATEIGQDNANTSRDVVLGVDMVSTIFFVAFLVYQVYISKTELRNKHDLISIRDYAVRISSIGKGCPTGIEREIQKQFIRFGKIVEIIPVKNFKRVLKYELEIRQVGEKIGDRKAKDSIRGTSNQGKLNELINQERKLIEAQKRAYTDLGKDIIPNEVIVVFDTVASRNDCLNAYSKFNHWYSCRKVPSTVALHGKYSYSVTDAPEPWDYRLENWNSNKLLPWIISIGAIALAVAGVLTIYGFLLPELDDRYANLPIYTECDKYFFDSVDVTTYTSATDPDQDEVSCFCRHLGYDEVEDNCNGGTNAGCKTLCQYWLDYHTDYYGQFFLVMFIMLAVNIAITYGFKLLYHPSIFKVRFNSTRYVLTAVSIFGTMIVLFGVAPEFYLDTAQFDLDRVWYLKSGSIYYGYFIGFLFLHPCETLVYWFV